MNIVRTVAALRDVVAGWRAEGQRIAVVPTMGGLHEGHLSLVDRARAEAGRVVTTLFVNPTQFAPAEDLDAYPRDEAADAEMLRARGCDLLFAPAPAEVYPTGFATRVVVDGLTDSLCGAVRAGHFDGVSQVVTKLLNMVQADVAVFGEKDWQQLAVVRRLALDLDIPTGIVGAPTVREADGLAMSSRNRYLTAEERATAARLPALMRAAIVEVLDGTATDAACRACAEGLTEAGFDRIDYVEIREGASLAPVTTLDPATAPRIFAAAHLGRARLIDNMAVA